MSGFLEVALLVLIGRTQAGVQVRNELRPLEFLVGSCWTGTFPDGQQTDTHCFESVFDGQFIRDRHTVRGGKAPYAGETLYAWDSRQKKVIYTYWASDGAISTGVMEITESGELVFPEEYSGASQLRIENVWTRRTADSYDVRVAQQKDGQWREMWRMTLRRVDAAKRY
jgi:hypothetical protein